MNYVIQFWNQYKELIYIVVALLCFVLGLIIKKKKTLNEMDMILLDVFERLPVWIQEIEQGLFSGEEKKSAVMNAAKAYVQKKYSLTLSSFLEQRVSFMIEDILETPQKHKNYLFRKD